MKSPKDWSIDEWYSVLSQRNELNQLLHEAQNKIHQLENKQTTMTSPLRPIQFEHIQRTIVKLIDPTGQHPDREIPKREVLTLTGHFHQFSTEGDGSDIGPVAIIETADGQIYTPSAHKCKFLDKETTA